ncbi:hypothetical protein FQZ97_1145610 [compost metagenome]
MQVIRQGFVVDPGRFEEHLQFPYGNATVGAAPLDQGGKAVHLIGKYLGFDLQTFRVA